jgi:hypothetical protein
VYNSGIKKIAQDTESAETNKLVTTVPLAGAYRPKLMNRTVSHKTRMMSIGIDIEVTRCSYINHRVCRISLRMLKASAFNDRCLSSFGKSP